MVTKKKKKITKKIKTEKVSEYFEVNKKGGEKIIKATGEIEPPEISEVSKKTQVKEQNRVLIWVFVIAGLLLIFGVSYYAYSYHQTNFTYNGIDFKLIKEGKLYFYDATIPVIGPNSHEIGYHLYTRNDPRKLEKEVPFEGRINLKPILILNATDDFVCEGYGPISVANLAKMHSILGTKVMKDLNATCDSQARYSYLLLDKGEENKITQVGEACYVATIKDCEILKVTERFIYETLTEINKK